MPTPRSIADKITRLQSGQAPRVLDLFAGCGGLSLGFLRAGFEITGAIEFDPLAAKSHANNFFRAADPSVREVHSRAHDITAVEPAQFLREIGICGFRADAAIDVVIGGPPCQAFARVGRAKLREVAEHPDAFKLDPRGNLYLRYLHFVRELRPLAILLDNVPDVMNYGGHNIAEETAEVLDALGYVCRYTLLNAVHYGVPEMRERMFLIAYRNELNAVPEFPKPTHRLELPRGYHNSRQVALKTVNEDLFDERRFYMPPLAPDGAKLPPAVTARDALVDLPPITEHLEGKAKRGARRFDEFRRYAVNGRITEFAKEMRRWPGFEGNGGVSDHVIRSLPRDYPIFRRMNPGDQYPEAHRHALDMFQERLADLGRNGGDPPRQNSRAYMDLMGEIVPPYDPTKFPNKWRKMEADQPARTLMAHLGKDSYSHIHYDSEQARTISVREAARLQSFPDGYVFSGTMNPAFRQIGNAVPPLLAYRIALTLLAGMRVAQ